MKAAPSLDSGTVIRARSVQTFVKRVKATFAASLLFGAGMMFFLIYRPLSSALQASLIDNFGQIFAVNYQSFQNNVQRGLEGARSLSSRTMIKAAIVEYNSGKMSMDALIDYCQSKYEDGARALESLVLTERFVDGVMISRYVPAGESPADTGFADAAFPEGAKTQLKIYLEDDRVYCAILSPVTEGGQVLGYDRLIFDLTDHIQSLCTDTIKTRLLSGEAYEALTLGAGTVRDDGETVVVSASDFLIAAAPIQEDLYFISKQDKSALFAPINRLAVKTVVAGAGTLLGFIIAVYLYVVRYAQRELGELETSHSALEKVASQVNIDPLTKAGSRSYGTENLMSAFVEFKAKGASPAVVMFDVDSFKHINDSLGHDAGDRVLREVVGAVCKTLRGEDRLFRWGGDEFVGIYRDVKEENALRFAGKILNAVLSLKIDVSGEIVSPTVSMGISYFKNGDTAFSDALKRADQAMYLSKAEGRNRANLL